jgi:hypothetical protein
MTRGESWGEFADRVSRLADRCPHPEFDDGACPECGSTSRDDACISHPDWVTELPSAEDLQQIVDFDHPFTVLDTGALVDTVDPRPHVPHVTHCEHGHDVELDGQCGPVSREWSALTGYTGQWSYNGAVMHTREYLGGRLAEDILAEPGVYVVTTCEVWGTDEDPEPEPAGWVVLKLRDDS